ncbi:MAG: SpoIVB peptidase S55 domain-containing protein [Firmicutes bacterium]|nr:SpoIVB peptidase S55 domain-containing protein [Bacillota bacterium]
MKRLWNCLAAVLVVSALLPVSARAAERLIPVGRVVGLQLRDGTVKVAAFDDVLGADAKSAGLKIGDELLKIGETDIGCPEDVRRALENCDGDAELTLRRGSRRCTVTVPTKQSSDGPRLGVYLRQGIAGIGTVTFYNPDTGEFGALGHGVSDTGGSLLNMESGNAYDAAVLSVKRGKSGEPGQLKGTADPTSAIGTLLRNTPQGVFGVTKQGWKGEPLPTALSEDIHMGKAVIRSTVESDTPRDYSVEILKIYPKDRADGRNLLLKVTDPTLLETTGGIVQGMSGSPIIQDGKLVGAVTHVLVNDPTAGYGIFIENMLDAAA